MAMPSQFTEELTLGERLARARRNVNLSQKAFATTVGLSARSVAAYELDQRAPAFDVVVRWAKITGAPVDYFADAIRDTVRYPFPRPVRVPSAPETLELPFPDVVIDLRHERIDPARPFSRVA